MNETAAVTEARAALDRLDPLTRIALAIEPLLDEPCPECRGLGHRRHLDWVIWRDQPNPTEPEPSHTVPCEACTGAGHQPTPLGATLLAFIARHQPPC